MTTRDKFRKAYSTTRQALNAARYHKRGSMIIGWVSVQFGIEARATDFGRRIALITTDPAITDAVLTTMQVR